MRLNLIGQYMRDDTYYKILLYNYHYISVEFESQLEK